MALLDEINYNPSEDSMQDVFDKINVAIQSINAVLGGGDAGELPIKSSSSDFDFEFINKNKFVDIQTSFSTTASTGDDFTISTLISPSDVVRNNIITVSYILFCSIETGVATILRKDGIILENINHTIINTVIDTTTYSTVVSYTFADLGAAAGTEYEVSVLTNDTCTMSNYSVILQSSL